MPIVPDHETRYDIKGLHDGGSLPSDAPSEWRQGSVVFSVPGSVSTRGSVRVWTVEYYIATLVD